MVFVFQVAVDGHNQPLSISSLRDMRDCVSASVLLDFL